MGDLGTPSNLPCTPQTGIAGKPPTVQICGSRAARPWRTAATGHTKGFLATPQLLPVLADTGHLDVAYELLFTDTMPSWLYMIDRGRRPCGSAGTGSTRTAARSSRSTTTRRARSSRSCTGTWPGIRLLDGDPGYRRFRVEPRPGGGITWAEARHDSPYGRIDSAWRLDGGELELSLAVPPGRRPRSGCRTDPGGRSPRDGTPCAARRPSRSGHDRAPVRALADLALAS